jgi:hypothetical protein
VETGEDEVVGAAPVDADVRILEVGLEVAASALGLQRLALLRIDLHCDVGVHAPPAPALLVHDAPEEHPEVPGVEAEPQEEQRGAGEGTPDDRWDEVPVVRDPDQEVEVVVLREHDGLGLAEVSEEVVHEWSLGIRAVRRVIGEHRDRPLHVARPRAQLDRR